MKITDDKLKGQIKNINEIEKNCEIILNNIEIAKRKKEQEQKEKENPAERDKEEINKYEQENKL